jgi:hypothetical protein
MTLRSRNQQHKFFPIDLQPKIKANKEESVFLISAKQAIRELQKKKQSAWLFFLQGVNADKKEQPQTTNPQLQAIINKFTSVFREELSPGLPPKREITHKVNTGDAKPVNINVYPQSPEKFKETQQQVIKLLQKGVVQPSSSE